MAVAKAIYSFRGAANTETPKGKSKNLKKMHSEANALNNMAFDELGISISVFY